MRFGQGIGLAIVVCAVGASARAAVVNGSFEVPIPGGNFATYDAPSLALTGWVLDSGNIDHVGSYWEAAHGVQSIDTNGSFLPGSIYQDLVTTPGQAYTLSFALAANPDGPPTIKTLEVRWDGSVVATPTSDLTGNSHASMGWQPHSFTVVANGAITRLRFTSLTDGPYGAALDNVAVTEVPEPGTASAGLALLGGVGLVRRRVSRRQ